MPDYDSIWTAASELSVPERLRLIDDLASTVPDDQPPALAPEWLTEINRRSDEIDRGTVATESWDAVLQRVRKSVGLNDAD